MIRTVLGDIDNGQLGWCQCHEHLFLEEGKPLELGASLCMDDYGKSLAEIKMYGAAGGRAFADAQPIWSGRRAEWMESASRESGVHIIASTGFHKHGFYYDGSEVFTKSEDELTEIFTDEIEKGMISSKSDGEKRLKAKAGIIKVAVDKGGINATEAYTRLFHAAVNAAAETGAAILAHFELGEDVFPLIRLMERAGLPPRRLLACHLDRARHDAAYHKEVADSGAYLEYDTINRLKYISNEQELDLICEMLEAGYEKKLLFSLDTTNERLRSYGANMGLDYILSTFKGLLAERGVSEDVLCKIMTVNPSIAISMEK